MNYNIFNIHKQLKELKTKSGPIYLHHISNFISFQNIIFARLSNVTVSPLTRVWYLEPLGELEPLHSVMWRRNTRENKGMCEG